jgi:CRISPR-associated protein Csx16
MSLPPELRGVELSVQQMRACGARLEEYAVRRVARTERLTQNGHA